MRRRDDVISDRLDLGEHRGADRLDLGDDEIGVVLGDRGAQRDPVEHREYLTRIGDLHRGRIVIAVAGDDPAAEPLGRNDEFAPQFARTEQQDLGGGGHARMSPDR